MGAPCGNKSARFARSRRIGVPVKALFISFLRNESGATAIEYGLIAGLISVVVITAVKTVGTKMSTDFSKVASNL
jgi:pilus assembly protein Flp/PilA